jgi:hypothetical protein
VEKFCIARQTRDNIIGRIRFACWVTNVADTHSEYLTLIAFPLQQCLLESASVLRRTQIACIVYICERNAYILNSEILDSDGNITEDLNRNMD